MGGAPALRVFISYSEKDAELKDALLEQLQVLVHNAGVDVWTDDRVQPGDDYRKAIDEALRRADVALLLVSASFLASKLVKGNEMPALIERYERDGLRIIPVLLKACSWQVDPLLGRLQMLPRGGQAVASFSGGDRDQVLADIAGEIGRLAKERANASPESRAPVVKERASASSERRAPVPAPPSPAPVMPRLEAPPVNPGPEIAAEPVGVVTPKAETAPVPRQPQAVRPAVRAPPVKLPSIAKTASPLGWFVGLVFALVALSALALTAVRRSLESKKDVEGRENAFVLARGIVACAGGESHADVIRADAVDAAGRRGLPPTSRWVPGSLSDVSARKYMSRPTDWDDEAFKCSRFSMSEPQFFQYQWERQTPTSGAVRARADFDGDGKADVDLSLPVQCAKVGDCSYGTISSSR
jgi:hypothetical protein